MKRIALLLFLVTSISFGRTAYDVYRMPLSGNIPGWGTVARQALPSVGQQTSSDSGTFSTSSGSFVDVTGVSITITTTGRPVMLIVQPSNAGGAAGTLEGNLPLFQILRGATVVYQSAYNTVGSTDVTSIPSIICLDVVGAGTYTYKLQAASSSGTTRVTHDVLIAYEL